MKLKCQLPWNPLLMYFVLFRWELHIVTETYTITAYVSKDSTANRISRNMPSVFMIHKFEDYWFKVLFASVIIDAGSEVVIEGYYVIEDTLEREGRV